MVASPELIIDGKSSQENVSDTKERVKSQVDKELQQLTNEIGKSFYSINESGEVEYNLDLVKRYLETKKDKKYSELKSQNTGAWIMAVQIVLSSIGYDVGKVDGILKNKGARTSKTVEQIIKFQRDNGLRPDGQPGSKTISKLLEKVGSTSTQDSTKEKENKKESKNEKEVVLDESKDQLDELKETITKAEFDLLCFRTSLTDEEMKKVVDYANKEGGSWLSLRITSINKNQLKELSKIKKALFLNEVKSIENKELEALSNIERLGLNGLRKITQQQAEILSKGKVKKLEMMSLNAESYKISDRLTSSMSNGIVNTFAKSETLEELYIVSVRLTSKQRETLEGKLMQ